MTDRTLPRTAPARTFERAMARLSRRDLLRILRRAGAAGLLLPATGITAFAQAAFSDYPFTLGVASGEPAPEMRADFRTIDRVTVPGALVVEAGRPGTQRA